MRPSPNRKSTPKVKDGKVQKKNFQGTTNNYYDHVQPELVIDRQRPGPGARHILTVEDIRSFIRIIPDWGKLSKGLDAIILTPFDEDCFGRYNTLGLIKLSAWPRDLWISLHVSVYERKHWLLERIGVEFEPSGDQVLVKFTEEQARAALLLGTFLHELGHHVDRMTSRNQIEAGNGEPFAEGFNRDIADKIWPAYTRAFNL